MASETLKKKKRDVLQLLRDYRAFHSAFGSAMPLDETGVVDASYGPAGIVFTGTEFEPGDREALAKSYRALNAALRLLLRDHSELWTALVEPYLADPADPGLVEHWRRELEKLDKENAEIRKHNQLVRKGKRPGPIRTERVALVTARLMLKRHDEAVTKLAGYLADVDLHYVGPKLLSEVEEKRIEDRNREMVALYRRLSARGDKHEAARDEVARYFRVLPDYVERILQFRDTFKREVCIGEGCTREPYQQDRCVKHYNRHYRARKKRGKSA